MILEKLAVLPQHVTPQRGLTWLAGWLAECRWVWLKNYLIRYFINRYQVDVNQALLPNLADHPNFNSFFTRELKPGLRPVVTDPTDLASPADGSISQIGAIKKDILLQAKGFYFNLTNLLGGDETLANEFYDGNFATIYLSPKDYHRVHMPITGRLRETIYIPGKLFSVSQETTRTISNLFAKNERLVCIFETAIGPVAVILVGAMLVGSINTIWDENPTLSNKITRQTYPQTDSKAITIERGAEMGHFKMGSTAILLFPKDKMEWSANLKEGSPMQMGQFLGKIRHP